MASTIPAVIDKLVALGLEAMPEEVQVLDGMATVTTETDQLSIGYAGDEGDPVVEAALDRQQLYADPDREQYDVICQVSAWTGDDEPATVRARAFSLLQMFQTAVRRSGNLGGMVMSARVAVLSYMPEQTDAGPVATVRFGVRINAFSLPD